MFGISMWELGLIALVALILLGPKQLTETAKVVGKMYREVLKLAGEVRSTVDLDSLTSSSSPPHSKSETTQNAPSYPDDVMVPQGDRKSGPDFYADLLESSKEPEEADEKAEKKVEPEGTEDKKPSTEEISELTSGNEASAEKSQPKAKE